MLRTRFTFAVAGAVAAVTLAVTAVAFLVVRADLQNQLKQELRRQAAVVHRETGRFAGHIPAHWAAPKAREKTFSGGRYGSATSSASMTSKNSGAARLNMASASAQPGSGAQDVAACQRISSALVITFALSRGRGRRCPSAALAISTASISSPRSARNGRGYHLSSRRYLRSSPAGLRPRSYRSFR
jgi:hypothetical protein